MKPYYQDSWCTVYCGDCREILSDLGTKVDLFLTDPPFFMPANHYQSRINWQRKWGDTSILRGFWSAILDASVPILKRSGHFLCFSNHESFPVFYPEFYNRFDFTKSLIWDKGHVGLGRVWRNQHEIIIAARWDTSEFIDDGKLRSDILKFKATASAEREHPVEKPESLLSELIIPTCPLSAVVCDPFMGSGTTLRAAKDLERKSIGIEIEERYCEIAARRMSQEILQFA